MTMGLLEAHRNSRLQIVSDAIDGGAGAGKLVIYDGTRPATGGAATNEVATLTFSDPCALSITGGVLTFNTITDDTSATGGTATWARCVTSADTFVCDLSVGATSSGEDIELNNVVIGAGTTVSVTGTPTITAGNA